MSAYADLIERLVEGKSSYIDPVARELWNRDGFAARDAISRLEREKVELAKALETAAVRFDHCSQMIAESLHASGTLRTERSIKAKHYRLEALEALSRTQEQRQ